MNKDISILITSCDKFHDTWEIVTKTFMDYWVDCPYDIYLMTNDISFYHSKINNIKIGKDESWSLNLKKALSKINSKYVFIWLDDVFLIKEVSNSYFNKINDFLSKRDVNYLRLRPDPKPSVWIDDFYGEIFQDALFYRVSIFATIWKKEILLELLSDDESAWDFEFNGSARSKKYSNFFSLRHLPLTYLHGIEKGLWKKDAVNWLNDNSFPINLEYRRVMSSNESRQFQSSLIKNFFLRFIPVNYKHKFMFYFQKIAVWIGFRKNVTFKL